MNYLTVYLGSDHVIQQPGFDLQKKFLSVTSNLHDAIQAACKKDAVGVLNTYLIDLDSVCVKAPSQQVLSGFGTYDVLLSDDPAENNVSLCSIHALDSLHFVGASFVQR